jgi:hypothetical protein
MARGERLGGTPKPEAEPRIVSARSLRGRNRRDFLLFGAGAAAAAAGFWWLMPDGAADAVLPEGTIHSLDTAAARFGLTKERREKVLNRALTFDDDVAEALFSRDRSVRTYRRSQITPLRNNYNGMTPKPDYLATWSLVLSGLASGRNETLRLEDLENRLALREQITRLVCVEGWSAVAWWGGVRFADLLDAFPPNPGARWAGIESSVNLDGYGESDPYYVSIDLETGAPPADSPRDAEGWATAARRARSAAASRRSDEARIEEHQGDHVDRLQRRRARRLLGQARLLQVRRALRPVWKNAEHPKRDLSRVGSPSTGSSTRASAVSSRRRAPETLAGRSRRSRPSTVRCAGTWSTRSGTSIAAPETES